jgi:hypothetical protein
LHNHLNLAFLQPSQNGGFCYRKVYPLVKTIFRNYR